MNQSQKQDIRDFFAILKKLKESKIIRSDVIFGDIGEFLCTNVFDGLKLTEHKTNEGYDAFFNEKKIQIKFSNSTDATNIDLGNPSQYEELIVVLGKQSAHRMKDDHNSDYLFYKFSRHEVESNFKVKSGYKLSKTKHFKKAEQRYDIGA